MRRQVTLFIFVYTVSTTPHPVSLRPFVSPFFTGRIPFHTQRYCPSRLLAHAHLILPLSSSPYLGFHHLLLFCPTFLILILLPPIFSLPSFSPFFFIFLSFCFINFHLSHLFCPISLILLPPSFSFFSISLSFFISLAFLFFLLHLLPPPPLYPPPPFPHSLPSPSHFPPSHAVTTSKRAQEAPKKRIFVYLILSHYFFYTQDP